MKGYLCSLSPQPSVRTNEGSSGSGEYITPDNERCSNYSIEHDSESESMLSTPGQ